MLYKIIKFAAFFFFFCFIAAYARDNPVKNASDPNAAKTSSTKDAAAVLSSLNSSDVTLGIYLGSNFDVLTKKKEMFVQKK